MTLHVSHDNHLGKLLSVGLVATVMFDLDVQVE